MSSKKTVVLSKIFSREKTFFYFSMWNDSDRKGCEKYLGYKIKNNLFLRHSSTDWGSVWYNPEELEKIYKIIEKKISRNNKLIDRLIKDSSRCLKAALPYLNGKRQITTLSELGNYYSLIVDFWSAMSILFFVPDLSKIPSRIRKAALQKREISEKYSGKMDSLYSNFWDKHFPKQKNLKYVLTTSEILKFKEFETQGLYLLRLKGFGVFNGKVYLKNELLKKLASQGIILEKEKIFTYKKSKNLSGQIACKGFVVGKVRLLSSYKDIKLLRKGEVLVIQMTNPDHVSAMEKAGAIVTDEGGITSHAAIVARELNKPCIIGTKIATKILKTGDLVEVDANNGIVKKLK